MTEEPKANLQTDPVFGVYFRGCLALLFFVLIPVAAGAQEPLGDAADASAPLPKDAQTVMAPDRAFELAESEFRYQDYEKVLTLLRPILYPIVTIADPGKRKKAREYLAISYWWIKDHDLAREEFTALLVENPAHTLDPFYNPGPLIAFFDSLKAELQKQKLIESANEKTRIQPVRTAPMPRPWAVNLLPFGLPQFTYGNPTRGWMLLVGQSVSLAASLASGFTIEDLRGNDGLFSAGDARTARDIRVVWWTSTILMGALYVTGVIDGFVNAPEPRPAPTWKVAEFEN